MDAEGSEVREVREGVKIRYRRRMPFGEEWTDAQSRLASLLYEVWSQYCDWPTYAWIEHTLYARHRLDVAEVLSSFPVIGEVGIQSAYYCDVMYGQAQLPSPETRVRLSVRGLWQVEHHTQGHPASLFLALLRFAGNARANADIEPFAVRSVAISSDEFRSSWPIGQTRTINALYSVIGTEPQAVTGLSGNGQSSPDAAWNMSVYPRAMRFAAGVTFEQYIAAVQAYVAPPQTPPARVAATSLAFLEALHFLDITWQRHCRRPLIQVDNPTAAGGLALDVSGEAEFQSRMSAMADLLKAMQTHSVPGVDGVALVRLGAYLGSLLDSEDGASVSASIDTLTKIMAIRHGQQHASAAPEALTAWRDLGVNYPPRDWNSTWHDVRTIATDAVMDLRDRVERLPVDGCEEHPRKRR